MKKLILFLIILTGLSFGQNDASKWLLFHETAGNLRTNVGASLYTTAGYVINVLGGKVTLTQTGAEVQADLDSVEQYNSLLYYLTNVSSDIQTQLDSKLNSSSFPGNILNSSDGDPDSVVYVNAAGQIFLPYYDYPPEAYPCIVNLKMGAIANNGMCIDKNSGSTQQQLQFRYGGSTTGILDADIAGANGFAIKGITTQGINFMIYNGSWITALNINGSTGVTDPKIGVTVKTNTITGDTTLAATLMYGGIFYVTSAATITLPAVTSGMSATFYTIGANAVSVNPDDNDAIVLDGTALSDGHQATNTSTAGDVIKITYYSADGWYGASNGWSDGS